MRNNKFRHIQRNMQAQKVFIETGKNLCTFYLALLNSGLSKDKVLEFDNYLHSKVPGARQDARDGIFEYKVSKALERLDIQLERIAAYAEKRNGSGLHVAYPDEGSYSMIMEHLVSDIGDYFVIANEYLGYGHIRLLRLLEFMEQYTGDAFADAHTKLGIDFGDPAEIPDMAAISPKRKVTVDINAALSMKRDLDGYRAYMEAVTK